jgi:hypothetical protein
MKKYGPVGWLAWILVIIGGLNWGLIAINSNYNIVAMLFGSDTLLTRGIYGLVGIAALLAIYFKIQCLKSKN